eukprot:COSAG02_NODE_2887_length_7807_cov_622.088350_4_plen_160_part_00
MFCFLHKDINFYLAMMNGMRTGEEAESVEVSATEELELKRRSGEPIARSIIHAVNKLLGKNDHESLNKRQLAEALARDAGIDIIRWMRECGCRGHQAYAENSGACLLALLRRQQRFSGQTAGGRDFTSRGVSTSRARGSDAEWAQAACCDVQALIQRPS